VQYYLKCFVKHDAWNEFGQGKFVSQPIKIMQPPPQYSIISTNMEQPPQDWNPIVMGEVVFNEFSTHDQRAEDYKM
jgi:hypothetical protein